MKNLRKFLTIGVMTLTVLMTSGLTVQAAAPQAGDLIKMDGLSAVYFLGNDGKRYVFPSESVFYSWHNDFSGVVTISASELASYPLGANIVVRPGTKLVKITTDPSVYAVVAGGTLKKIASEADAIAIFGANWAKRVIDVSDAFFTNYTISTPMASGAIPAGTLVKNANSGAIYLYDGTNYRSIANEAAFVANRFSFANVITITNPITAGGTAITGAESALTYDAQAGAGTGTVVTSSGVTVSISANTAAGTSIVSGATAGGQALADMASFNFTASNDGQAVIRTIRLKRIGVSSDSTLSNVYLYDGATRLTDGSTFSNGYVSFSNGNGILTVAAGQTKTLTVKADVAAVQTGNIGVAINAASDVVSSAAAISGSFPLNGNIMSVVQASDLAAVALATTTLSLTAKAGNTNTIVWSETANVTGKAVDFKYIAFKQIGSINADDLANLSLYVDGTKVGTSVLSNNDLAFNLTTAVRMNTGNHTIELKADIIKGSSRTFSFSLQTAVNAVFTDTNYNVNVAPTGDAAIAWAPSFTISSGTLSASADTTFGTTEVVKTATNATLSRFKIKAFGEDVKINQLVTTILTTGTTTAAEKINDLAIVVNGTQVGSTQSITLGATAANQSFVKTFGTNNLFTIPAGTEVVVEVRGTLSLLDATQLATIKANLTSVSAQGVSSYATVTSVNADAIAALNVVTGSMTVAKNSAMQDLNVAKNVQKTKIGSFILTAGSAEGVNISNLRVNILSTTTSANLTDISNLYISENTTPVNPQAANDFNTNLTIAKSQSKTIDVYADLGDIADGKTIQTSLAVTYKTDVTMTFGTKEAVNGQILTVAVATLGTTTIGADPVSFFVLGGATATAANYKFVANNGSAFLNELTFSVNSATVAMSSVTVGGVTAPVVNGAVTLTGLNKEITAGLQGVLVPVVATYIPVTSAGQGGVATAATSSLTLTSIKYTVNGVQSTASVSVKSNDMKVVSSYPTVAPLSIASSVLVPSGKSEVMKFSVTATGATSVNLKQISVNPYFSYNATSTGARIYIEDAAALGTALATTTAKYVTSGTAANVELTNAVEIAAGTTKTFVVFADNTGTAVVGDSFRMDMVNTGWLWNDGTISGYTIDGTYVKEYTGSTLSK